MKTNIIKTTLIACAAVALAFTANAADLLADWRNFLRKGLLATGAAMPGYTEQKMQGIQQNW